MAIFKTRARALDMLGRQQIAGIPTAINELFKNAHDAYADRVEVDFFRSKELFLLRDDGLGMTKQDFETRWLTLGTESKVNANTGLKPPPTDPGKPVRPILGEKGIGRLAIAVIGPQVLILTRAKRSDRLHDLVAAFIHWGLFESPGVDLDQIDIPVRTFPAGELPSKTDIAEMVGMVRSNIRSLASIIEPEHADRLLADLASFEVDPKQFDGYLHGPSLRGNGHGTHFYITPTNESLVVDIEGNQDDLTAPPLLKNLLGFTDTMTPSHTPPRIKTAFRDHTSVEAFDDLIAPLQFFTPEEFQKADHHIEGKFNEYGQFEGTVTVYNEQTVHHIVPWPSSLGNKTECGLFELKLGYVQGKPTESKLPPEEWYRINEKLKRIGGLYIYKDGIRILPYGNNDFDWLDIEKRRSQNLRYFFSYRRMFGRITISQKDNSGLSEKAGREGFRENKAYRQFRSIMKNFFDQIAADFFREDSKEGEFFNRRKAEIDRIEKARRQREKESAAERSAFDRKLESFFSKVGSGKLQQEVNAVLKQLEQKLQRVQGGRDSERIIAEISDAASHARQHMNKVRESYKIDKPAGLGLTPQLSRDWDAYLQEATELEVKVFVPAAQRLEQIVDEAIHQSQVRIDRKERIRLILDGVVNDVQKGIAAHIETLQRTMKGHNQQVLDAIQTSNDRLAGIISSAFDYLENLSMSNLSDAAIIDEQIRLESRISVAAQREQELLIDISRQLERLVRPNEIDGLITGADDVTAALEEEVLALRERSEMDLELAQLGMAIEVINHEFNHTVQSIRSNLRRLKAWADLNQNLKTLYQELRTNFEHLDGYLTLFTPLHRRLYRSPVEFSGADISQFLRDLFKERLQKNKVVLETTDAFSKAKIIGYPSTFYPVFVNLVDNAIFWLKDSKSPRIVKLDAEGDVLVVADSGPGIPNRDRGAVFELGFTRKSGGRGLGLYISRDVLAKIGYDLTLDPAQPNQGAVFRIKPQTENDGKE